MIFDNPKEKRNIFIANILLCICLVLIFITLINASYVIYNPIILEHGIVVDKKERILCVGYGYYETRYFIEISGLNSNSEEIIKTIRINKKEFDTIQIGDSIYNLDRKRKFQLTN